MICIKRTGARNIEKQVKVQHAAPSGDLEYTYNFKEKQCLQKCEKNKSRCPYLF